MSAASAASVWTLGNAVLFAITVAACALCIAIGWVVRKIVRMKRIAAKFPGLPDGEGGRLFRLLREDVFRHHLAVHPAGTLTFGIDSLVSTIDPKLFKTLLLSKSHSLGRSWLYRSIARLLPWSDGILFMADEQWKRRHKAFTPVFGGANLRHYTLCMFEGALVESWAVRAKQRVLVAAQAAVDDAWEAAGRVRTPGVDDVIHKTCRESSLELQTVMGALAKQGVSCLVDIGRQLAIEENSEVMSATTATATATAPQLVIRHVARVYAARNDTTDTTALLSPQAINNMQACVAQDYDYCGPAPEADLLTHTRWMAVRVLFSWGLGMNAGAAHTQQASLGAPSVSYQYPLACLGRALDDYARTALEVMPHNTHVGWLSGYLHLWQLGFKVRRLVKAVVASIPPEVPLGSEGCSPLPAPTERVLVVDNRNQVRRSLMTNPVTGPMAAPPSDGVSDGIIETHVAASVGVDACTSTDINSDTPTPTQVLLSAAAVDTAAVVEPVVAVPARPVDRPLSFIRSMVEAGFTLDEMTSEVNHVNGAHKAVAFTTSACLFELSRPVNIPWRQAVRNELMNLLGKPQPGASFSDVIAHAWAASPVQPPFQADTPLPLSATNTSSSTATGHSRDLSPALIPAGWRPPERADLESGLLPVTTRVWKETLRLHVVSMGTLRVTGEDMVDSTTGVAIPAGTDIQLLLHALHTHPDFWGDDALVFDPNRWLPNAINGPKRPDVFFPFLDGTRRCAGMYLAELQFVVLLYVTLVLSDLAVELPQVDNTVSPVQSSDQVNDVSPSAAQARLCLPHGPRHSAVILNTAPNGTGTSKGVDYKLRMRADMFSAFDGRIPFTTTNLLPE